MLKHELEEEFCQFMELIEDSDDEFDDDIEDQFDRIFQLIDNL